MCKNVTSCLEGGILSLGRVRYDIVHKNSTLWYRQLIRNDPMHHICIPPEYEHSWAWPLAMYDGAHISIAFHPRWTVPRRCFCSTSTFALCFRREPPPTLVVQPSRVPARTGRCFHREGACLPGQTEKGWYISLRRCSCSAWTRRERAADILCRMKMVVWAMKDIIAAIQGQGRCLRGVQPLIFHKVNTMSPASNTLFNRRGYERRVP